MEYKNRIADKLLRDKLEAMGAVLIEGPKACGKTTTAEQQAKSIIYMDDPVKQEQYKLEKPRDFDPFGHAGFAHLWLQYD